ncbi:MAG: diacylglycerol kinase family protein [Flavobacteriales bacterium]|nr:diacylglycerol kinase family protein [Flavobacteriales bacterium]
MKKNHNRISSFRFAWKGIVSTWKTEPNFKIHFILLALTITAGFLFHINSTEWIMIVMVATSVLAMEIMNTAIETLTDLESPEYHALAGKTKDLSAAAVLVFTIGAALTGLFIFVPKIYSLLFS